ncbi:hypothetical protein P167DRAFT_561812 [Morchella conica CCBAS932]|uniref:Uncharacterized protein n=1 Tax=Morchella conica CCBAS932 TaxID=1392247 RepID=A0A3N4L1Z3_9PEZI|nr:hypothetical protein P167DRAFT_561812 [Morchella conica CCBAS932]
MCLFLQNLKDTAGSSQSENAEVPMPVLPASTTHSLMEQKGNGTSISKVILATPSRSQTYSVYENISNGPLLIQDQKEELGYSTVRRETVNMSFDKQKYVSESCRKALDRFKYKPQVFSSVGGCDNLKVESELHNPNFVSGPLPEAELKDVCTDNQNYAEDDKLPLFLGGLDSDMASDYGSDSGLFELCPMLDIHQGPHTFPNNDAHIVNNYVKIIGEEEFGDIDDDEMLEAITYLEKHTTTELIKNKWDSDSDMDGASIFDDYPTTEGQADNEKENIQNASKEKFLQLHSLPVISHKPATQEKLSADDIVQGQNQSLSTSNKDFHASEICPSEELPTGPEPGIATENFSMPSDVKFALNDYSQDQEVFDLDLQRSAPPENFVEELVSGLDTFSCEESEETPGGAVGPENGRSTEGKGDEDADLDVIEIEREREIEENLEEGEDEDESESEESALYMSKKRKAQRKTKPAKATRERKPQKKRKIRVVDPSQPKLSDYMGFSKPPPVRPRVGFSERIDLRQNLQFIDIFHEKPPFLNGFYELGIKYRTWEETMAVFLGESGKGKMIRVVGNIEHIGNRLGFS